MANFLDQLGQAAQQFGNAVNGVVHEIVTNPGKVLSQVPGGLLVAATAVPNAVVLGGAEIVKDVARATHNPALEAGARNVIETDQRIVSAAISDPGASLKILGGAALIATGNPVAGSAALVTGIAGLGQDVARPPPAPAPPAGKPTPEQPRPGAVPVLAPPKPINISTAAPRPAPLPRPSLWARFVQWVHRKKVKPAS